MNNLTQIEQCGGLVAWATLLAADLPVIRYPALPRPMVSRLAVSASHVVGLPLKSASVTECCGQVFAVSVVPNTGPVRVRDEDPVIPLTLVDMGRWYNIFLRRYYTHVWNWRRVGDALRPGASRWWGKARRRCDMVLYELGRSCEVLRVEELAYLVLKLQEGLAFPTGMQGGSHMLVERR